MIDWSDETKELEDKAFWSKVRDIIRATFDKQTFQSWVEKLKESTKIEIKKPIEGGKQHCWTFRLKRRAKAEIANALFRANKIRTNKRGHQFGKPNKECRRTSKA